MKLELFNNEAHKLWKRIAGQSPAELLQPELEFYKKLLTFFQVGESCYFIFNFQTLEFDLVSDEVMNVLGYEKSEISAAFIMDTVHPEDRAWFLSCQEKSGQFLETLPPEKQMKYKLRFDCRFREKNGNHKRLMMQAVVVHTDENGGIFRTLIVFTDISHLKNQGKPVMSYIGMDGEPSYLNVNIADVNPESNDVLTPREKQILSLLMEGKLSKEISEALQINKQTVDKHRKNMLKKTGVANTSELIVKAIKEGWV